MYENEDNPNKCWRLQRKTIHQVEKPAWNQNKFIIDIVSNQNKKGSIFNEPLFLQGKQSGDVHEKGPETAVKQIQEAQNKE